MDDSLTNAYPLLRFLCYLVFPISAADRLKGVADYSNFGRLKRIPYAWSAFLLYMTCKFFWTTWPYVALRDEKPHLWGFLDILLRIFGVHTFVQFVVCHFARTADMSSYRIGIACLVLFFPTCLIVYPLFWDYIPYMFCATAIVTALVPSRKDEDSQTNLKRNGGDQ